MKILIPTIFLVSSSVACHSQTTHDLKVGVFDPNLISETSVRATVTKMNEILADSDPFKCTSAKFDLVSGPDAILDSDLHSVKGGNFKKFSETGFSINIVSQVLECGKYKINVAGQSFGGCTAIGSKPVVVTLSTEKRRPLLWLHEFGHSQGLRDRCGANTQGERDAGCLAGTGFVMRGMLADSNLGLEKFECDAFSDEQNFPVLIEATRVSDQPQILDLLAADWTHSMPLDRLTSMTGDEISTIRSLLLSDEKENWPNAILALGLSGDASQAELIYSTLSASIRNTPDEPVDFSVVDAKLNVPIALGYLANLSGNSNLLSPLSSISSNDKNRAYFEEINSEVAIVEYSYALARNATIALGLNPKTEVAQAQLELITLRSMAGDPPFPFSEQFFFDLQDVGNEVESVGLIEVLSQR